MKSRQDKNEPVLDYMFVCCLQDINNKHEMHACRIINRMHACLIGQDKNVPAALWRHPSCSPKLVSGAKVEMFPGKRTKEAPLGNFERFPKLRALKTNFPTKCKYFYKPHKNKTAIHAKSVSFSLKNQRSVLIKILSVLKV